MKRGRGRQREGTSNQRKRGLIIIGHWRESRNKTKEQQRRLMSLTLMVIADIVTKCCCQRY